MEETLKELLNKNTEDEALKARVKNYEEATKKIRKELEETLKELRKKNTEDEALKARVKNKIIQLDALEELKRMETEYLEFYKDEIKMFEEIIKNYRAKADVSE